MTVRSALLVVAIATAAALQARAEESRPAIDRPEIREIGDPILIDRKMLAAEMRRDTDLRDWVHLYGAPEYAEVQEIEIDPPFAPYEVRLYYIRRNAYLAFGRVHVAPNVYDYGIRKYIGRITPDQLDRLLTARAASDAARSQAAMAEPVAESSVMVETVAVQGVPVRE